MCEHLVKGGEEKYRPISKTPSPILDPFNFHAYLLPYGYSKREYYAAQNNPTNKKKEPLKSPTAPDITTSQKLKMPALAKKPEKA
jgi:hypothetical protein